MEMQKLVTIYLILDALVVVMLGFLSVHGEHGWDFLIINVVRLAVMVGIVALWRATSRSQWVERVLFGKRSSQD